MIASDKGHSKLLHIVGLTEGQGHGDLEKGPKLGGFHPKKSNADIFSETIRRTVTKFGMMVAGDKGHSKSLHVVALTAGQGHGNLEKGPKLGVFTPKS